MREFRKNFKMSVKYFLIYVVHNLSISRNTVGKQIDIDIFKDI